MAAAGLDWLLKRKVDHLGYVVEDIPTAVADWAKLGIGPFYVVPNVEFDELHNDGRPAVFDHSAAFARWGQFGLELQEIHRAEPEEVARALGYGPGRGYGMNHVAYACEDPEADSARLAESGYPLDLYCRSGPIEDRMHFVPGLGHNVEIHRAGPALAGMWAMIEDASQNWDGSDPMRHMPVPS